jgi:hypothetical protein
VDGALAAPPLVAAAFSFACEHTHERPPDLIPQTSNILDDRNIRGKKQAHLLCLLITLFALSVIRLRMQTLRIAFHAIFIIPPGEMVFSLFHTGHYIIMVLCSFLYGLLIKYT